MTRGSTWLVKSFALPTSVSNFLPASTLIPPEKYDDSMTVRMFATSLCRFVCMYNFRCCVDTLTVLRFGLNFCFLWTGIFTAGEVVSAVALGLLVFIFATGFFNNFGLCSVYN